MPSFKEILLIIVVMLLAGLGGFALYNFVIAPSNEINTIVLEDAVTTVVEKKAPFSLTTLAVKDIDANPVTLDQWSDKILVINFWATWCPPCRKEIPMLIETQSKYADTNVQFLGIAMDDADAVKKYMQLTNFNYPILISDMNETIRIGQAFNFDFIALPFTLFMSADGKIRKGHTGELDAIELEELIQSVSAPSVTAP